MNYKKMASLRQSLFVHNSCTIVHIFGPLSAGSLLQFPGHYPQAFAAPASMQLSGTRHMIRYFSTTP
jgi:hypothetical protein